MKKLIIILIWFLSLSSCGNSDKIGTQSWANTSWITISSWSISSSWSEVWAWELTENQEILADKSFFYNSPTDAEPRKAYVMKWDSIKIDATKSTNTMIYAKYTSSNWNITEWYLKRTDITNNIKGNKFGIAKVGQTISSSWVNPMQPTTSNCKRIYDFGVGNNWKILSYRQFEFNLVGDCTPQKETIQFNDMLGNKGFKLLTGEQSIIWNFLTWEEWSDAGGSMCIVENPIKNNKINKNWFSVQMIWWNEACWMEGIASGSMWIWINIYEQWKNIIYIYIPWIQSENFNTTYNDILWTMENGFRELQWSQKITLHTETLSEKMNKINWTKELLEESEFTQTDTWYTINWEISSNIISVNASMDPFISSYWWCNDYSSWKCVVDKVSNGNVYWRYKYYKKDSVDGYDIKLIDSWEIAFKTSIDTGKTEKISEKKIKNWCIDQRTWKDVKC